MPESTLRRPLMSAGLVVIAALVVLLSGYTLLARGTFTSTRVTETLSSGWVALGVRAPESAGGVVTVLPVGGPALSVQPVRIAAASDALAINDAQGLSQSVGDGLERPMAGAIILDRLALAGLVDAVGGIDLETGRGVTAEPVHLDGIAASSFVLRDPTGQRLFLAVHALLRALPEDRNQLLGIVKSLGMSMRATVSAVTVVQWLEFWQSRL